MIKVSLSWLNLKPNLDNDGNQEEFLEYTLRIRKTFKEFKHIPDAVFKQWLWEHHNNYETLRNYAWIDYEEVDFVQSNWTNDQLLNINIINEFSDYVENRAKNKDTNDFVCEKEDKNSWIINGTWRVPPIVLDVSSIKEEIPTWSEIKSPYQLVEGHSRLGYLKSMINISKLGKAKVASSHSVFIMKIKQKLEEISDKEEIPMLGNVIDLTPEEIKRISDQLESEM